MQIISFGCIPRVESHMDVCECLWITDHGHLISGGRQARVGSLPTLAPQRTEQVSVNKQISKWGSLES